MLASHSSPRQFPREPTTAHIRPNTLHPFNLCFDYFHTPLPNSYTILPATDFPSPKSRLLVQLASIFHSPPPNHPLTQRSQDFLKVVLGVHLPTIDYPILIIGMFITNLNNINAATTATLMLNNVPTKTYSVLGPSSSLNRNKDLAATVSPAAS